MKRLFQICFLFLGIGAFAKVAPIIPIDSNSIPGIRFTENKGQWSSFIKIKAEVSGGEMYLSGNAFVYHFVDFNKFHDITHSHKGNDSLSGTLLKVAFLNANKSITPTYSNPYPDHQNYFLGDDPKLWREKVYSYQNVKLENFYPNIDLELTSRGQDLKYDLIAKPNADLTKIAIKYSGQQSIKLLSGFLYIETEQCRITELKPVAYQTINGIKKNVSCQYILDNDQVRFSIGSAYDPNYSLTIDPQIVFSSFTGSRADNFGFTATYDLDGNAYIGGIVFSYGQYLKDLGYSKFAQDYYDYSFAPIDSFPASPGAYQTSFQGGYSDVVIFKFSKDGERRQYATYLGGSLTEEPHSLVVNSNNELVVFGATGSNNFPKTNGVFLTTGSGSNFETYSDDLKYINGSSAFITILNETGTALIASNVIKAQGNSSINYFNNTSNNYYNFGDEFRGEVIVDKNDNVIVATYTAADKIPNELSSKVRSSGDSLDAWVFKLSSDLTQLKFSKRFGGSGMDAAFGLQPDSKGNLFFAGHTTSTDLLGTLTGLNNSLQGKLDGYVAKMDSNGNVLACTYLGTAEDDQAFFVQTNLADEVFVMGQTWSNAYPINSKGISPFYSDPGSGQFIHKLDNTLSITGFSTVFGSKELGPDISPTAFLVDNCGLIYVAGWRGNLTNPDNKIIGRRLRITETLYNPTSASGFYFAVFELNMKGQSFGSYFGGDGNDHVDGGTSRFDKRGYIYEAICGGCLDINGLPLPQTPTTPNVWSPTNKSFNCNMVGVKYDFETVDIKANFTSKPPVKNDTIHVASGQSIEFNFTGQTLTGSNVYWETFKYPTVTNPLLVTEEPSWIARPGLPLPTFISLRKWQIEVDYAKSDDCIQTDIQTFYIAVDPSITGANVCNGDSGQFNVIGSVRSVQWTPVTGLSNPDIKNPKVFATQDTSYTVEVWANDNSYFGRYKVPVKVIRYTPYAGFGFLSDSTGTYPLTVAFDNQSFSTSNRFIWDMGDGGNKVTAYNPVYTFDKIGRYNVTLKVIDDSTSCQFVDSVSKYIYVKPKVNDVIYCPERPFGLFTVSGGILCIWDVNGQKITSCTPVITFSGITPMENKVVVYSEQNKPYSYIFTITGNSSAYPPTVFNYAIDSVKDWNSATVKFIDLTKVKTKTWDVDDGKKYTDSIFTVEYNKMGTYPVIISGTDTNSCAYRTENVLQIEFMVIPNVFTPNGDHANEAFEIRGLQPGTGTLEVFNRWGSKVFDSGENNYKNDWRADNQADGIYFYNFRLNYRPDKPYKGWIQVIR